jgi:predicted alpha-1,2-mannosidase
MLGTHTTTLFADALAHGIPFDAERAWKAVRFAHFEGSLLPWHIGPETSFDRCYREKGYCPALRPGEDETLAEVHPFERRQAVAVTLEQAYDDYAAAKLADKVGAAEDAATLRRWSQNYRNVFDPEIGFMAPRDETGAFIRPYDPKLAHAQGGRDYFAECNGWVYTMEVRHDPAGLAELLGGKEALARRMDALFCEQPDMPVYHWLSVFPDSTGLIGQFCMGNEPAFHIPYFYNFCGQPWKTQKILHDICRVWFSPHPLGICGDEDGGAMCAWFVFSAMGFYPVCPGRPEYDIGSPIFERVTIRPKGGKPFTIEAKGNTSKTKYIRAAELNGKPWNQTKLYHSDILAGGKLTLHMDERPNPEWGA